MADPTRPATQPHPSTPAERATPPAVQTGGACPSTDAMPCDRCGTAMFRMHAVWRCPNCGFKTDCCGW